jgi:hypothetical protein
VCVLKFHRPYGRASRNMTFDMGVCEVEDESRKVEVNGRTQIAHNRARGERQV